MQTVYGPEAQNGDYVLVLDVNYMARSGTTYLAKVYNGKAYTGKRIPTTNGIRYIHKKSRSGSSSCRHCSRRN